MQHRSPLPSSLFCSFSSRGARSLSALCFWLATIVTPATLTGAAPPKTKTTLSSNIAAAAAALPVEPRRGELELRGRVQAVLAREKRLVLEATEVTPGGGGAASPIDPPRPKTILVGATTVLRDDTSDDTSARRRRSAAH
jgi:hypothetical protein